MLTSLNLYEPRNQEPRRQGTQQGSRAQKARDPTWLVVAPSCPPILRLSGWINGPAGYRHIPIDVFPGSELF